MSGHLRYSHGRQDVDKLTPFHWHWFLAGPYLVCFRNICVVVEKGPVAESRRGEFPWHALFVWQA